MLSVKTFLLAEKARRPQSVRGVFVEDGAGWRVRKAATARRQCFSTYTRRCSAVKVPERGSRYISEGMKVVRST